MAADDDTETEVFEITDFTTASEWERFVSRLEEVLNDWKLIGNAPRKTPPAKGEFTSGVWNEKTEEINFADFKFCITHHFLEQEAESESRETQKDEDAFPVAMQDLLCMNNDFPPRAHCLVRWFGLRSFVVVSPGANCEAVISESKCNLLLSSVSIALQNSGCQAPVLMQVQQKWRRLFTGECQGPGVRVDFEMVHLHKVPTHYKNLSGLLDIFKNKIGCTLSPLPPINISIRFTYILQDWQQCTWPQQPPDFDGLFGGEVGGVEFGKVPFGACAEPISELHLAATWPHLTEGIIVDNDVYSELDPLQAPHWSVRIRTVDNAQCLLGDFLMEFFRLTLCSESLDEILGRSLTEEEGGRDHADISSALQKLTQPSASVHISKLSVSHMVHSARRHMRRRRYEESPLSNQSLNTALLFLFPDAAVEKTPEKSSPHSDESQERDADSTEYLHLKAAPLDSLTHRLALCLASVNHSQGGLRAVAHLWQEFVLELRYRWENNYLIHGLPSGPPDLRCCLLHQKLQMLNCCIERKRSRDEAHRGQSSGGTPPSTSVKKAETDKDAAPTTSWESWSDSEDEFYECVSDLSESNNSERKPEGRLKQHRDMRLLHTHQPLYIPVTQEPSPLTEDMLEQQSEVLSKLGTSAEGAHLRARMQSACLLSDMEAFKAANPGCVLEDFVRWYSPRDYISEEHPDEGEVRGGLSARMRIPGNMWLEAWDSAKATPARRQRRLFDDTTEAEKVLHHLSLLKPSELVLQLLPSLILSALGKLREEEASEDLPSVKTALDQASVQAGRLLHQSKPDLQQLEEFLLNLMSLETSITRARSLKAKFGVSPQSESEHHEQLLQFVSALLEEPEVEVTGAGQGPAGSIIHQLFISAQRSDFSQDEAALLSPLDPEAGPGSDPDSRSSEQVPDFPPPTGREMILRTCVPSPACYSRALPQRMFCVILKDEFRLAAALSHDTAFF